MEHTRTFEGTWSDSKGGWKDATIHQPRTRHPREEGISVYPPPQPTPSTPCEVIIYPNEQTNQDLIDNKAESNQNLTKDFILNPQ